MLRIVVVEDDLQYRAYLESVLRYSGDLTWVRGFDGAEQILAEAERARRQRRPPDWDLVLVALELGGMGGFACVRSLRAALPDAGIVVLSLRDDPDAGLDAVRAGADGYLLKRAPADQLLAELRATRSGGVPLSAEVSRAVVQALRHREPGPGAHVGDRLAKRFELTPRELDVLRCLARGRSYKAAARDLGIGVDTVRTYVRSLYAKLGVHNAAEAVGRAIREGLV